MVIGLLIYGSLDTLTGGYLYDRHLVDYLESRGHHVKVISLPAGSYIKRLKTNGSKSLLAEVTHEKLDILLQDELCHPSLVMFNRRLGRHIQIPVIAIVHHLACREPHFRWYNRFLEWIERCYLNTVDGFIFNSKTTRQSVGRLTSHEKPSIVAQPAGNRLGGMPSTAAIEYRVQEPGPLRLLYLGLVIPRKGLLPLVDALTRIPEQPWQLDVVGSCSFDTRYAHQVRKIVNTNGLHSKICFLGTLDTSTLATKLRNAHILCMPYAYEGFGMATLEALTLGVPVFGSTRGATGELVRHGINGLLFAPDDRTAVAAAVTEMQKNRERLVQMSIAAAHDAARQPSWQLTLGRIENFLTLMTTTKKLC